MIERLEGLRLSSTANIALIHPNYKNNVFEVSSIPLGLAWLSSYLETNGYNVECFDLSVDGHINEDYLRNTFSIVGIQLHSEEHFEDSLECVRYLRRIHPDSVMVVGGIIASLRWNKVVSDPAVDILVLGEGEVPLTDLLKVLLSGEPLDIKRLLHIKGLAFNYNGKSIFTGKSEILKDLDQLPLPNRSGFSTLKYAQWSIITSRGCPYQCSFCTIPRLYGGQIRFRGINSIYREICTLQENYGMEKFIILDDTFTVNRDRVMNLCKMIIEGGRYFSWSCLTRADKVDNELLKTLSVAGCKQISYGIESINQNTLDRLNKRLSKIHIEQALRMTKDSGIRCRASFIFGLPGEKYGDILRTIDFICSALPEEVQIYPLMPYSQLPILSDEDILQLKWLDNNPKYKKSAFDPLLTTKNISKDEIRELLMICIERLRGKGYYWVPGDIDRGKYGLDKVVMTEFCPAQF
jgi:anaerobic magnesium-protoporphyrin IX monomethyl ester cyclase